MAEMIRAHLRIYGRVQGVFFRANMRERARMLGLTGWVRNMPDGSVEAVIGGPRDKVLELVKWAHKGPRLAKVEKVDVEWEAASGEYDDFYILYH
jgi:acylphosphatase